MPAGVHFSDKLLFLMICSLIIRALVYCFSTVTLLLVLLSRGLYLTSIFYRDDNVLVTPEDQIPIVEIEDSYSSSLMQDFLWFTKARDKQSVYAL